MEASSAQLFFGNVGVQSLTLLLSSFTLPFKKLLEGVHLDRE